MELLKEWTIDRDIGRLYFMACLLMRAVFEGRMKVRKVQDDKEVFLVILYQSGSLVHHPDLVTGNGSRLGHKSEKNGVIQ